MRLPRAPLGDLHQSRPCRQRQTGSAGGREEFCASPWRPEVPADPPAVPHAQSRRLRTQETLRQLRLLLPSSSTSICSPRSSSSAACSEPTILRAKPLQALVLRRQPADVRSACCSIPALRSDPRPASALPSRCSISGLSADMRARILASRCGLRLLPARSASLPRAPDVPSLGHACEKAWHELIQPPLESQRLLALRLQ